MIQELSPFPPPSMILGSGAQQFCGSRSGTASKSSPPLSGHFHMQNITVSVIFPICWVNPFLIKGNLPIWFLIYLCLFCESGTRSISYSLPRVRPNSWPLPSTAHMAVGCSSACRLICICVLLDLHLHISCLYMGVGQTKVPLVLTKYRK